MYDERVDENGNPMYSLIKKDCKRKWYVSDVNQISDIREIPNKRGIVYKNKCEVYHKFENRWVAVAGKFNDLKIAITPKERYKIKGFK